MASPPRGILIESTDAPYSFTLEPAEIDLKTLRPDQDAQCEFFVVNRDERPLPIANIDGSCDCIAFTWSRGDVAPGERRRVAIDVHAENRGNKLLSVMVQAYDSKVTTRQVTLRYVVLADVVFSPDRVSFGKRMIGSPTALDLQAVYELPKGAAPIAFETSLTPPAPVVVELGTPSISEIPGGLRRVVQPVKLTLGVDATTPWFESTLLLASDRCRTAKLPVTGEVHRGCFLDKNAVQVGFLSIGGERRASVRLLWSGERPVIESFEGSVAGLSATAVEEAGERSYRIDVTFVPTVAGDVDAELWIKTNLAPEPLLLRVRGKVR